MGSQNILVLSRAELESLLDEDDVIDSQRAAFLSLANGTGQLAPRLLLPGPDASTAFCYASRLSDLTGPVCKFGSVNPANHVLGLASVSAIVILLDPVTGQPRALLDGESVTTARTPAASTIAAQLLARPGARTLTVLGGGVQGRAHARMLARVLGIDDVRLHSPSPERLESARIALAEQLGHPVQAITTAEEAVAAADLIVTATTSHTPVLRAEWLRSGATVISVGSFAPDRHEIGQDVLQRADLIAVDHLPTARDQAGPIAAALAAGTLTADDILSLGELLTGTQKGRTDPNQIAYYNSVGVGIQDAAAAWMALDRAQERGLGTRINV
jgi:ornithine cyclodeaminase